MSVGRKWGSGEPEKTSQKSQHCPPLLYPWRQRDPNSRPQQGQTSGLNGRDHRLGRGVTSLLLMQQTRVQSPDGLIFWLGFLPGFFSTVRRILGNLTTFVPIVYYPSHIYPSTDGDDADFSCNTWPSLNNPQQLNVRKTFGSHPWGCHLFFHILRTYVRRIVCH